MNGKVFVVTHKHVDQRVTLKPYSYIGVGENGNKLDCEYCDSTGVNISEKNPYYCELTALYWIWKNYQLNEDYYGLCHYRRFFTNSAFSNSNAHILNEKQISHYLQSYDIILPIEYHWKKSVGENYSSNGAGKAKDLNLLLDVMTARYPEYLEDAKKVLESNHASYCNMFIMNSKFFSPYCEWLFNLLNDLEGKIDCSNYNVQEKRVFGYLSEIMINIWAIHNQLKIKHLPIAYTDCGWKGQIKLGLRDLTSFVFPIK